jgi:hypothetical protein
MLKMMADDEKKTIKLIYLEVLKISLAYSSMVCNSMVAALSGRTLSI